MGQREWQNYVNKIHIENTGYLLLMPILIDLISVLVRQFGVFSSSTVTMAIYGLSLAVILIRLLKIASTHELINDCLCLIILYMPFLINYILFENTRTYIVSQDMLIVDFFFIPLSVFTVRKITKWEAFFDYLRYPGYAVLAIAAFIMIFLDYQTYLVYMGFSYALLPFICNFYRMARIGNLIKKRVFHLSLYVAGMAMILAFGARAAVAFGILYIFVFEILRSDNKQSDKLISIIVLAVAGFAVWLNITAITQALAALPLFKDSYFMKNLLKGNLLESTSRDTLYEACRDRINTVGISVSGFFGDRQYCLGYAYPHNIIYEVLMSQGWLLGIAEILAYVALIIKGALNLPSGKRDLFAFLIITMFARYFVSGSYLVEGRFWLVSAMFIGMTSRNRDTNIDW